MERPCRERHPDPAATAAGCRLCFLYQTRPDYRQLWGGDPAAADYRFAPAAEVKVWPCPSRKGTWNWSVVRAGQVLDSGREASEERARREAATAAPPDGPLSILITGGIGDVFALEGMMRPEERDRLTTIHYACPSAALIADLWGRLPNFPRLRNHVLLPSGRTVHYERPTVERAFGPLPPDVADWSIRWKFPERRPYLGSSFLAHRVASPAPIHLPYVVVVPRSRGFGGWAGRDLDAGDWDRALAWLERHDLFGAVLVKSVEPLPASRRLIDLQGKTTLPEAVELLKAARGYLGIDSCLSVLAAKLFPASRLAIKSTNAHAYKDWPRTYYSPWAETPFLCPRLEPPE